MATNEDASWLRRRRRRSGEGAERAAAQLHGQEKKEESQGPRQEGRKKRPKKEAAIVATVVDGKAWEATRTVASAAAVATKEEVSTRGAEGSYYEADATDATSPQAPSCSASMVTADDDYDGSSSRALVSSNRVLVSGSPAKSPRKVVLRSAELLAERVGKPVPWNVFCFDCGGPHWRGPSCPSQSPSPAVRTLAVARSKHHCAKYTSVCTLCKEAVILGEIVMPLDGVGANGNTARLLGRRRNGFRAGV